MKWNRQGKRALGLGMARLGISRAHERTTCGWPVSERAEGGEPKERA